MLGHTTHLTFVNSTLFLIHMCTKHMCTKHDLLDKEKSFVCIGHYKLLLAISDIINSIYCVGELLLVMLSYLGKLQIFSSCSCNTFSFPHVTCPQSCAT